MTKNKSEAHPISARDFLEEKFGNFNQNHPLSHLGYTKGLEPDIADIIAVMEEYKKVQPVEDKKGEEWINNKLKAFEFWIKENGYNYRSQISTMNDKKELVESKVGLWYSWGGQSVGGKPLRVLFKEFLSQSKKR